MEIKYFTPPQLVKHPFRIKDLLEELGGWQYASKGRWCLYHILKSLSIKGPVLVPIYCCNSILQPIKELGLKWYCYDLRCEDLNPDVQSVENLIEKYNADCVLAVSMYGNPADLDKLEEICHKNGVQLIDDAAQSFGATLNGKRIGYWGDAGFFSFSPGKPLAGHLGGAFWTNNDSYRIKYNHNRLYHWFLLKDFQHNRINNHFRKDVVGKIYGFGVRLFDKLCSLKNNAPSRFEEGILYGVYKDSLYIHNPMRTAYANKLYDAVTPKGFSILKPMDDESKKGIAHKYVLICESPQCAQRLNDYLHQYSISSQFGYRMLCKTDNYPNAQRVDKCIVEVPLYANKDAFQYIKDVLNKFS